LANGINDNGFSSAIAEQVDCEERRHAAVEGDF
jgi:hypothetical protein